MRLGLIAMYLAAIITANLTTALWGPSWSIVNAFLLIGLDLTSRDALHDRWRGTWLWPRMALLIGAGSLLSWFLSRDTGPIAVASFVAFASANVLDALTYTLLGKRARLVRVNGSNLVSATADSLIFPTLAFGGLLPWVVLGQFAAKVAGGFLWSLVLNRDLSHCATEHKAVADLSTN